MIEGKHEHYIRRLILIPRRLIKAVVWIEKIKRRWQRNKRGYEEIFRHRNPALVAQAFNKFYSYIPPIEFFNHRVALQSFGIGTKPDAGHSLFNSAGSTEIGTRTECSF